MRISEVEGREDQIKVPEYSTWYEFKKDLEKEPGRNLLNDDWLQVKPAAPLPWSAFHLHSALAKLERPGRQNPGPG